MTKKYTLTTSEETVTENPEDIIRLMKLAGLKDAQPVAEEEVTEEVEAEVYEPTEANDELDLDDYSKKSPESINKQKKSIQPTLGDNPLEYSLDENEIYEAMMKEFPEDKVEETAEEKVEETDELKEEELKEDCDCGHGSDCDCDSDCDCGCNESVNEERVDEDESVTDGTLKALQHLVDSEYDDIGNADGSIAGGDMFGFHGSPYTAEEWAEYAKYQIDEIFTKHGSSVPPEIAKVYNGLVEYSKETELQAERRKNTEDSSPNAAPYYPENEDEMYIRDNFAEQWRHAFFKVVDRLGIEEVVDEDQNRLKDLINYQN